MQVNLTKHQLAKNWHKVKLAKSSSCIYVNVESQCFSLSPVLHLDQLKLTLQLCKLGDINTDELNAEVRRIAAQIKNSVVMDVDT